MASSNVSRKGMRPKSSAKNRHRKSPTLNRRKDFSEDHERIETFVAEHTLRSKSARSFAEAVRGARRELRRVWNPRPMHALSSGLNSRSSHLLGRTSTSSPWDNIEDSTEAIGVMEKEEFGRAEDHIALEDLIKLREKFHSADIDGDGTLDMPEFVAIFNDLFHLEGKNEAEILTFFNKIDFNCDGCIDWDEFCTYMYLEYQEREESEGTNHVEFSLPAEPLKLSPHRDSICSISNLLDGSLVSCSQDGVICLWGPDSRPKRVRKADNGLTGKPKWITDMALCVPQNKILLTTGEHEIQFYELMNFEPYCQLRRLDSVPLKLHFWYNPAKTDECCILIGDKEGTLTVLSMDNIQEAFKYWKLAIKIENGMPTYSIDKLAVDKIAGTNFYRWKLHTNWVTEVQYFGKLRCFASCSCDPINSIVVGTPAGSTPVDALLLGAMQLSLDDKEHSVPYEVVNAAYRRKALLAARNRHVGDQRIFSVSKGVTTIRYCPKNNLMVTGGLDQIIRIWNPFITGKPVALLYGQGSPVFGLQIDSSEQRIYSIGNDNIIKVWNLVDHSCVLTLIPSAHKVTSPVEYFYFNPVYNYVAIASDHLSLLRTVYPKGVRTDIVQSHLRPITTVRYSHCFNQIVTSCEGAMLKVWDISTGKKMFEFSANLGSDVAISSMDVDKSGKRIVTGGDNGQIKVWNYNNGQCVRVLEKGTDKETSDIKFITLNENKYIIAVGWDRKLYLFPDLVKHMEHSVQPIPDWSQTSSNVHNEDILCIAVGYPNLMATSSYDGEVVLWSVISCHMLAKLVVPKRHAPSNALQEDGAINKVLFLDKRSRYVKTAATLVSSGPDGKVHFWNVYYVSAPMGVFYAKGPETCIIDMAADEGSNILTVVDTDGYVSIFDIATFCLDSIPKEAPKRLSYWKAHTQRITSVQFVDRWSIVVTGSSDGAVRIWTVEGQYIGTFGQENEWHLGDPSSYYYPDVLRDILYDNDDAVMGSLVTDGEKYNPHTGGREEMKDHMEVLDITEDTENWICLSYTVFDKNGTASKTPSTFKLSGTSPDTANTTARENALDQSPIVVPSTSSNKKVQGKSVAKDSAALDKKLPDVSSTKSMSNIYSRRSVASSMKVPNPGSPGVGKRLRHLRTHSAVKKDETKSKRVYANLMYYPLEDDEVKITKPVFDTRLKR